MMVMVAEPIPRHHDHARRIAAVEAVMVMMVVVMMMIVELSDVKVLMRSGWRRFIDRLQCRCCVRDRLQQLGEGTGVQDVCRSRRRLSRSGRAQRGHGAEKSGDFLFHRVLHSPD